MNYLERLYSEAFEDGINYAERLFAESNMKALPPIGGTAKTEKNLIKRIWNSGKLGKAGLIAGATAGLAGLGYGGYKFATRNKKDEAEKNYSEGFLDGVEFAQKEFGERPKYVRDIMENLANKEREGIEAKNKIQDLTFDLADERAGRINNAKARKEVEEKLRKWKRGTAIGGAVAGTGAVLGGIALSRKNKKEE